MRNGQSWQCPFCSERQVLSDANFHLSSGGIGTDLNRHSVKRFLLSSVECMNSDCREITLSIDFVDNLRNQGGVHYDRNGEVSLSYPLRPSSAAKPQHDCVPKRLVADYDEACAIAALSPKASATLARLCLQGMIRDFCDIDKATLHAEITELAKQVEAGTAPRQVSDESIAAIDAVRKLGNIGAHFEKDINVIVDVDPDEALTLISLLELLFEEWYVARFERQQRLEAVKGIAASKAVAKARGIMEA